MLKLEYVHLGMLRLLVIFQRFSIWFKVLLSELANNLVSLFFIGAVYLTLFHFPQAIDLLLILNQADTFFLEVPLYFGLLTISSFLIWNAPKYFYFHNYHTITFYNLIGFVPNKHYRFQDKNNTKGYYYRLKIHIRKVLPRILGAILLVISALSILNAMEIFGLENTYTNLFDSSKTLLVVVLLLLMLTELNVYQGLKKLLYRGTKFKVFVSILYVGLLLFIISLGTFNTQAEKDLGNLFIANCTLALLFIIIAFNSYFFLKQFPKRMKLFYGGLLLIGFSILILFLILNFNTLLVSHINPLSILLVSFISFFMLSFIFILLGKKIRLPLLTIVIICSLLGSFLLVNNSDHYSLNLVKSKIKRPNLDEYLYNWIISREDSILNSKEDFPVILVSAEGGGSRAGLWSFLIHSYLYHKSQGRYFKENLLSLTGASGGSVGNSMFFAAARNAHKYNRIANFVRQPSAEYPYLKYKASAIYKENYLSVSLMSLLGRDLFKETTGLFSFKDRGKLLENQWNVSYKKGFDSMSLQRDFLSFYDDIYNNGSVDINKNVPPLLFVNTTHIQTGNYNIISPVRYNNTRSLAGLDDFLENLQISNPNTSISLATAMRINAGFPFITPVGEIKNTQFSSVGVDQYADAGYYDNIGGRVSNGIEKVFKKIVRDSFPNLEDCITIKNLIIINENVMQKSKKETQLSAPLVTLKNVRSGHTQEILERLGNEYVIILKPTEIVSEFSTIRLVDKEEYELKITPILPLGRYLSTIAIRSIEARLKEVSKELDSILEIK